MSYPHAGRRFAWRLAPLVIGLAITVGSSLAVRASDTSSATVLEFNTMTPVVAPFLGATNPIRGVTGGGLPWVIAEGRGELLRNGALEVRVRGLVLDPNNPAVIALGLAGVNPFSQFRVLVSCLTTSQPATGTTINAGLFPATRTGDMEAETTLALPSPCVAPIVFVTSPTGAWFATTGA